MVVLLLGGCVGAAIWRSARRTPAVSVYAPRPAGTVTFNKDIAPIIFSRCAICHHPGQSTPFNLLTLADVKEHARQIVAVTHRRYMPPWLPEPGFGRFADDRRLTVEEIGLINQWASEGGKEGELEDLPPPPSWTPGWQLGRPDLIVRLPEPYTLAADGKDVYRNFVLRVPLDAAKYIKGVELQPGNPKVVHHAFIKVDPTAKSRHLDEQDPGPGFAGMNSPAQMPGGQFLTWQPGKLPSMTPDGLAWRLDPGDDLVVQMHLRPSGKVEQLQPAVGLYFTSQPPTNTCFKFSLCSYLIDIPPGEANYELRDSYVLPVDVELLGILPHAHYLCQEMQGFALLPDGTRQELLLIKHWDFNWQGDYRYAAPISLPRGTTLHMRYVYDNSTNNVRNPNHPPKRIAFGPQSSDEMGELWFQVLVRKPGDLAILAADYNKKLIQLFLASEERQVLLDPQNAPARTRLGRLLNGQGRRGEAWQQFQTALKLRPDYEEAHYESGLMLRQQKRLDEAREEFETVLRLNPNNYDAHGNLGLICATKGDAAGAEAHFRSALQINPDDTKARDCLNELLEIRAARARKK